MAASISAPDDPLPAVQGAILEPCSGPCHGSVGPGHHPDVGAFAGLRGALPQAWRPGPVHLIPAGPAAPSASGRTLLLPGHLLGLARDYGSADRVMDAVEEPGCVPH